VTTFDGWDPSQYNQFSAQREQPFWDLAHLVKSAPAPRVVDLGCGDGRLTALLGEALGAATTLGVDSSRAMIERAKSFASNSVRFELGDIGAFEARDSFDVVFANASMQWVPDHPAVMRRWSGALRPGGQLAVQVPSNADHPAHLLADELAREFLADPPPDAVARNVLAPETYAELLDELGYEEQHVRLQVYVHHLSSSAQVVEWMKGTSLTRFKEPMGDAWDAFVDAYRERLAARLGERRPYLYAFKRILMWGQRP
jgi:trans-aconitate 2-methyltransferase